MDLADFEANCLLDSADFAANCWVDLAACVAYMGSLNYSVHLALRHRCIGDLVAGLLADYLLCSVVGYGLDSLNCENLDFDCFVHNYTDSLIGFRTRGGMGCYQVAGLVSLSHGSSLDHWHLCLEMGV